MDKDKREKIIRKQIKKEINRILNGQNEDSLFSIINKKLYIDYENDPRKSYMKEEEIYKNEIDNIINYIIR